MSKENYELLQVSEDASDEAIEESYKALKAKYNEEKWQYGEAGTNAAKMLGRLDAAYAEIIAERKEKNRTTSGASAYDEVSEKIKQGDISGAQALLDGFNERGAEWHYLQSVVFYKKNWMNESKKQLEIAMQMDAQNAKYRDAYENLKNRSEYTKQTGGAPNTDANPASGDEQMGGNWCASCANFCYTFLCVNCLFNLCCNCR